MGLSSTGGGYGVGRYTGGVYICYLPLEHRCTIYCNKAHYGPGYSSGAYPMGKGAKSVV